MPCPRKPCPGAIRVSLRGGNPDPEYQAHRTIRTALGEAVRRGHLGRNPAALAKPPGCRGGIAEEQRRAVALALGLRQGEALGLKCSDVDLDNAALTVRRALFRPKWRHGCDGKCERKLPGSAPRRTAPGRPAAPAGGRPPSRRRTARKQGK
ncbi:hypothetical protein GCM10023176_55000 [Micromonospora coerulea]|uniref:Tyr recombinase domain-containing protein n=1 Tax=Micromonospora coerulea TaxID=47856 RepID=A0ABP8T2T0_9ACTN